jgi:hypothetical protein
LQATYHRNLSVSGVPPEADQVSGKNKKTETFF